ncbi:protein belonging to Uncharacterized protein family UPF0175 [Candidatus Thiomargarita nelsonii]|uniref:Protein belonging to Uncharacterized protein family UPF0175 n=1 Tax=Candidatus Thiomargarita nelsonii TaxID=1003181 RepID=A0A176RTS4_9GAMM|nr:protein belonging to Uncharacterized protein family UPF0175 [Candidatus Thiomargarita nelsonii]
MQAIEFSYESHDGMIKIPEHYKDWIKKPIKVILFAQDMPNNEKVLLAAVAKWYELGLISQGKGAELMGLSREEFMLALSRLQVSPYTAEDLEEELQNAS